MNLGNRDDEPLPLVRDFAGKGGNLGDMWSALEERHQKYWDIYRPAHPVPQTPPIGAPPMGPEAAVAALGDRVLKAIEDLCKCCWWKVQPPTWLEPTITSIRIDRKIINVELPPGTYAAPVEFKDILCIEVPDLMVAALWGIGTALEDDDDFDVVEWREIRNGAQLIDGRYFFQKADPTKMHRDMEPVPIILPPLSTFCLQARNTLLAGPPKVAVARITGHMVPVREFSGNGAFSEWCVT